MLNLKSFIVILGTMAVATPAFAGTPTLAGAPPQGQNYDVEKGVKVFRLMRSADTGANHFGNQSPLVHRAAPTSHHSNYKIENGVRVHRLMSGPSVIDDRVRRMKKKAKANRKKAFKKGYNEGYQDGYQTALENTLSYRRPIRLRQRIRTRPRVSPHVRNRRNLY